MDRRTFVALLSTGIAGCAGSRSATPSDTATSTATPSPSPATAPPTDSPEPTTESPEAAFTVDGRPVERNRYDLRRVPDEKRPQFILDRREPPRCAYNAAELDEIDDLQMATIDGETGHMPIRTSWMIMRLLHCHRAIDRDAYLERAEEIAAAYLDSATTVDGVPYFAYMLAKGGSGEEFEPP